MKLSHFRIPAWLAAAAAVTVLAISLTAWEFSHAKSLSLHYTLQRETLLLKFNADGWLYLHFSPGADTIEHAPVHAGQTLREPIPNNATETDIIYSSDPNADASSGVQITRTDRSGTVDDPSGKRIEFLLKFYQ